MKKLFYLFLCLTLLLTACVNTENITNKVPFISTLGNDGEFVFTGDLNVLAEYNGFNLKLDRANVSFDPETNQYFGTLEGNFSKGKVRLALNFAKQITKTGKNTWFYKEMGLNIMVPENGIILFSSSDVKEVYYSHFQSGIEVLKPDISERMINSDFALYVNKPNQLPDFGFEMNTDYITKFDYVLCTVYKNKGDFQFSLNDNKVAESLVKLLKTSVLSQVRKEGIKLDKQFLDSLVFIDNNTVYLNSFDVTGYGSILEVLNGRF